MTATPGDRFLLYLGRIHPKKNLSNLLRAWAMERPKTWKLVIIGWDQGGHEDELKRQAALQGLSASVIFTGPQFGEAKSASFHHCDAFVLPSLSEGLPMVVLEAWAHGKPTVMTPECNLPLGYQQHAAIKIGSTAEEIAAGLRTLFTLSSNDIKAMGENGHHLVKERFTWPRIASEMRAVYSWLISGGLPPATISLQQ